MLDFVQGDESGFSDFVISKKFNASLSIIVSVTKDIVEAFTGSCYCYIELLVYGA